MGMEISDLRSRAKALLHQSEISIVQYLSIWPFFEGFLQSDYSVNLVEIGMYGTVMSSRWLVVV